MSRLFLPQKWWDDGVTIFGRNQVTPSNTVSAVLDDVSGFERISMAVACVVRCMLFNDKKNNL